MANVYLFTQPRTGASSINSKKPYGQRGGYSEKIKGLLLREEAKDSGQEVKITDVS